ncbi:MAG: FAD-dependent oxidoreductase [Candidatus Eisenbacteria bacterium]
MPIPTNDSTRIRGLEAVRGQIASDLLVMGGGVLGLSTAIEAMARGLTVTLFDDAPEKSATLAAAGMLSPYAELIQTTSLQEIMKQGRASYPAYVARVEEVSGCRVELAFPGTLMPGSSAADQPRLEQLARDFAEMGARSRYLAPSELSEIEPNLGAREAGAVLLEDEGYVNTHTLHIALRSGFERLGGTWIPLQALGLTVRQQRVVGVETANGVVLGGAVLNATGAAGDRFLLPEDQERYRARPIRGQAIRLKPADPRDGITRVIQMPGVAYLVPQADGSVIAGATSEAVGPFPGVTAGGVQSVLQGVERLVPCSKEWSFAGAWSALRPMAGEGQPVLAADARKGLFHGLGLYRHGILLAPVAATRLAKLISDYLGQQNG